MKRLLAIVGTALIIGGGAAYAASAITVSVNGVVVPMSVAPRFESGHVLVPADELAESLGATVAWDESTKTLHITDERVSRIAQLEARIAELEKLLPQPEQESQAQVVADVTKDNLVEQLQERYGTIDIDGKTVRLRWSRNPFTPEDDPLIVADITDSSDRITFLELKLRKGSALLDWARGPAELIAAVYPKSSTMLVKYSATFSFYPSANYEIIEYAGNLRWRVTEYEIWVWIKDGKIDVRWDTD